MCCVRKGDNDRVTSLHAWPEVGATYLDNFYCAIANWLTPHQPLLVYTGVWDFGFHPTLLYCITLIQGCTQVGGAPTHNKTDSP